MRFVFLLLLLIGGGVKAQCDLLPPFLNSPPPPRTMSYDPKSSTVKSCGEASTINGFVKMRVRGGFVVDLFCYNAREYLWLPQQSSISNFATSNFTKT
jgi:hypothetical protein